MRKTYDMKQVKISTSILWLLNKAETRNVFYNSMDIFSNKANLHLHSLIIRGLISGELYCAALSKLFPYHDRPIRTKDFQYILDSIIELDSRQLAEVLVLQQKHRVTFIENLTKQEPFELSEHLQLIDALMSLHLCSSELICTIPTILGKLCDFRPNIKEPKKLLEIWFKCMTCLSLSKNNILDTVQLIKSMIIQENFDSNEKKFVDSIKFSDKVALILFYESEALEIEKEFIFDFSDDGSTNRNNVKHNFITVIQVFRKYFPKVLEDFKELMLVLNSSHIQIPINLLINIDLFIFEFFTHLEEISNRGNRTFRTGSQNSETKEVATNRTFRVENPIPNKEKIGIYHTMNKPPVQFNEKYSKFGTIGTYSGKKILQSDYHNSKTEDQSINWGSQKSGNNLLYTARKTSVPNGLNLAGVNKNVSTNLLLTDGTLKSKFLSRKASVEKLDMKFNEPNDENQTSWILQSERIDRNSKSFLKEGSSNHENEGLQQKINETRLRLNMKRQEIEGNRRQVHQQLVKEHQLLSDKVFKDVTMGISQTDVNEINSHKPKRVSDMKRSREHKNKSELSRSRSQDFSKSSVEDINVSLNQIKSEISKLTSEQAKLSAKFSENKKDNVEAFSPRLDRSTVSKEDDNKTSERSSIRSMPISWHPYNSYGNEDIYNNFNMNYAPPYPYSIDHSSQRFYPPSFNHYLYGYPSELPPYQISPPVLSINPHHMTKSLRDNVNSRPSSPGAMSEPLKSAEVLPEKPIEVTETEPLTIQNLIKHNKSMDKLPNNIIYLDNNSTKSLNHNNSKNKVIDFSSNSIKASSVHSSVPPVTHINPTITAINNNDNDKITTNTINSETVPETSSNISLNEGIVSKETPKVETESHKKEIKNVENSKIFFVSFDDENINKKLSKKPKIRADKESNNNNNNKTNSSGKKNDENLGQIKNSTVSIKTVEKPLAFLITVDNDTPVECNTEKNSVIKDKLLHLTEKREQERKEKLEKIKEIARIENEKRLQKELEKEKIKEERKRKRDAIFEAHLVKKLEEETSDPQNRLKDVRVNKKPIRAMSAVPTPQKTKFNNDSILDIVSPSDTFFTDLPSFNSKREKIPINLPGPKLFVEPKSKSNKNVILNAIKYCCLAGKVNESVKQQTIEELERFDASHFMILMRGACQYRSLYRFELESQCLTKLSGTGPKKITNKMVEKFFKYNSGAKKFIEITSTNHLSTVIDGVTIYNTLWKTNTVLNNQLNFSETSSQAEHISQ